VDPDLHLAQGGPDLLDLARLLAALKLPDQLGKTPQHRGMRGFTGQESCRIARRKPPPQPVATDSLPAALRPESVVVQSFVPGWEQPPAAWFQWPEHGGLSRAVQDGIWRKIIALRRCRARCASGAPSGTLTSGSCGRWGCDRGGHQLAERRATCYSCRPPSGSVPPANASSNRFSQPWA
jgi:hypothetical protein